jgi:phosphatidylethanolamine/phosphatidyl-N-methylethanolamine N-methyltransferase
MGSITPSSASLGRVVARNIHQGEDEAVVEFGGGTGAITRSLLESGVPASHLFSVEIDTELASYMRRDLPDVQILQGDVRKIRQMLPARFIGKVGTVVVGIPMVLLPWEAQQTIIDEIFAIMPEGRHFLAYTYSTGAPLKYKKLGLSARRVGFTLANLPPASVWAFTRG